MQFANREPLIGMLRDEFENFVYNLNLTLEALTQKIIFLTVIIALGTLVLQLVNSVPPIKDQLLKEPTHISDNYRSCINLIFTSQPNLVDFGIHTSLHENCHHQIIYSKFYLKIFYPPPHEKTVWHYQQVDMELIKRSLESFDCKNAFSNCNPNEQVSMLTKTSQYYESSQC